MNDPKNINYIQILKNAWKITWRNKYLWWFGFFIALSGGGISSYNFNSFGNNGSEEELSPEIVEKMSYYWSMYSEWIIVGIVILFLIILVFCVLGIIGRGGLISSLLEINKNNKTKFSWGFKEGKRFFWKLLTLNLIFGIVLTLILAIFAFPIIRLLFLEAYGPAILLSVIAIPIVISIFILIAFLRIYSQIYLVGNEICIVKSISLAYNIFKKNIKKSILMGVVLMAVGIIMGIAIVMIILTLSIPLIIFWGVTSFLTGISGFVALLVIGLLILLIFNFFLKSVYIVFVQATWILFFNKIAVTTDKTKKELQEETKKVPELGQFKISKSDGKIEK